MFGVYARNIISGQGRYIPDIENSALTYKEAIMSLPKEHPYADILRAIADGKEIETRRPTDMKWEECRSGYFFVNYTNSDIEFRIKPEVKTGWIGIYSYNNISGRLSLISDMYESKEQVINNASSELEAVIQISYTPGEGL